MSATVPSGHQWSVSNAVRSAVSHSGMFFKGTTGGRAPETCMISHNFFGALFLMFFGCPFMLGLCCNMGPTWPNLAPTWPPKPFQKGSQEASPEQLMLKSRKP